MKPNKTLPFDKFDENVKSFDDLKLIIKAMINNSTFTGGFIDYLLGKQENLLSDKEKSKLKEFGLKN